MNIYIPSLGRYNDLQISTLAHWPKVLMQKTYLVVTEEEYEMYKYNCQLNWLASHLTILPTAVKGIAATRLWIGCHAQTGGVRKFVMVDDDLRFLIRIDDKGWQLRNQNDEDTTIMIRDIEAYLDKFAHVSVSPREGNNRVGADGLNFEDLIQIDTRSLRVLAYQTDKFLAMEHSRVAVMEDFDVNLQLLEHGYHNLVHYWYANGQRQTQMRGGCSLYRTHEEHEKAAKRLADLHPGLVRLRQKQNKGGGEFGTRTEVTIQWKKAYKGA